MITKPRFRRHLATYLRKEGGAVIPLVGLAFVVLIGMMGMAIDIGRAQLVEAKLLNSLDAAGLAAGAKLNSSNLNDEVQRFVAANFPDGYVDATVSGVQASLSADETTITVTGTAVVPTTFMQIFGKTSIDVNVTSEITRAVGGLELVLVLDNTGSMCSPCSKIADLKAAANNLIDIVFGDNETGEDLHVGVVPFSQSVNIGASHSAWLDPAEIPPSGLGGYDPVNGYEYGIHYSWGGCVEARVDTDRDLTDDPPSTELLTPYFWVDNSYDPDDEYSASAGSGSNLYNHWIVAGNTGSSRYEPAQADRGPNKNCPAEVTTMTSTKSTLTSAINGMQAVGYTHINFGAVWGWRMLSPRWRGLWGGDMDVNELPLDYNTERMTKAAVIMTDGDNTHHQNIYTAYDWLTYNKLGTRYASSAVGKLDARLTSVCTAMKNTGIYVYTVSFGSGVNSTTQAMMENCASHSDFYFHAPSGADLESAFVAIGDSLANLRVSR